MIRVLWLLMVLFLCFSIKINASNAGAYLRNGVQPKAAGLSQAYTVMGSGSDGIFWNPALLGVRSSSDMTIAGSKAFETTFLTAAAYFDHTQLNLPLGVMVTYAGANGIPETKVDEVSERLVETGDQLAYMGTAIAVGTGKAVSDTFWVGASGKLMYEKAGPYQGLGLGGDIGTLYKPTDYLKTGVMFRNIVRPAMRWDTPSKTIEAVPRELVWGTAYTCFNKTVTVTGDWVFRESRQAFLRAGVEYRPLEFLPVWAGMNGKDISLGTGIEMGAFAVSFAWTKTELEVVEDAYQFGVRVKW